MNRAETSDAIKYLRAIQEYFDREMLENIRDWATQQVEIKSMEIKTIEENLEISHIQRHNFKLFIQELDERLGR